MSTYTRSHHSPRHFFIQNKLISAINDPAFELILPELKQSTWNHVLRSDASSTDERERLEFLGDALMHASVALELYKTFPGGSPHLFTVLRAAMNTNCTFTHYMLKVGAFEQRPHIQPKAFDKVAADAFETLIAAYYFEQGFQAVCAWVSEALGPLILVARSAYDQFVADRNRPQQQRDKRMRRDLDVYRAGKKMRLSILSEPNHILGSRHAQTIIPNTVKTRYEKKLAKCRSELDISKFNSSKPTRTTIQIWQTTSTGKETAVVPHMYGNHQWPSSGPDDPEADDWIDVDDDIQVKSTSRNLRGPTQAVDGIVGSTGPGSKNISSTAQSSPCLQQIRTAADGELSIPDTPQVSRMVMEHLSGVFASNPAGPGKSDGSGNAITESCFTGAVSSTDTLPLYSTTEEHQDGPVRDLPNWSPGSLRYGRAPPPMHVGAGPRVLGSTSHSARANAEVTDVAMPVPILQRRDDRDMALGSFKNPISVDDGDDDVAMTMAG